MVNHTCPFARSLLQACVCAASRDLEFVVYLHFASSRRSSKSVLLKFEFTQWMFCVVPLLHGPLAASADHGVRQHDDEEILNK